MFTEISGYDEKPINDVHSTKEVVRKRLPDFLIIGVEKGGTGALQFFLSAHPSIVRNKGIGEENNYFSSKYNKGIEWYINSMPKSLPGQLIFEKTANYFYNPESPKRIYLTKPDIKLLLIVKNPFDRAVSKYNMQRIKRVRRIFEESWEQYVWPYDSFFENWLKFFKRGQIHIVDGDIFTKNPVPELNKIEEFLNVSRFFSDKNVVFNKEKGFYCSITPKVSAEKDQNLFVTKCAGGSKGHVHPNVSSTVADKIKELLRPYNERFYELAGIRYDWND